MPVALLLNTCNLFYSLPNSIVTKDHVTSFDLSDLSALEKIMQYIYPYICS